MASYNTFNAADTGSTILTKLNQNFNTTDTAKIEAATADTLTNKTIDVDNNTVSNIETDNLKASAKTGSDTAVVTGTAGTANNLAMWNADGDAVDSTYGVLDEDTMTSDSATDVPTQQSVKAYVDSQFSSEIFIYPGRQSDTNYPFDSTDTTFAIATVDSNDTVNFNFRIPTGFSSVDSAKVVIIPDATETINFSYSSNFGAAGELQSTHTDSGSSSLAVTNNIIAEIDVSDGLTDIAAGDYVGFAFSSSTTNIQVIGMYLKFS